MNTKIKVLASSLSIAGLTLGTALIPALAGNVNIGNDTTGANSVNTGDVSLRKQIIRLVSEIVTQRNVGVVDAQTGNNDSSFNTGDGWTNAGGVNFSGGFSNLPSTTIGPIVDLHDVLSVRADNDTTGFSSSNILDVMANLDAIIDVTRTTRFDNDARVDADTGNSAANFNTGDGRVGGGDVSGSLVVTNQAPVSGGGIIAIGGGSGIVDIGNDTTGAQSINDVDVDLNKLVSVSVNENTTIDNRVNEDINTGNNSASFNTGDGDVDNGSVNSNTSIVNSATSAAPVIVDAGGPVSVRAENHRTGFSSFNAADVNLNDTTVVNVNKTTSINNSLTVNADTGNSSASFNTGDGRVRSGHVNTGFNVMNR